MKSKWMKRAAIAAMLAGVFYMGAFAQANGKVFGKADVLKGLLNLATRCEKAGRTSDYAVVMEAFGKIARSEEK